MTEVDSLDYGPVKVVEGPHKGRIGYMDDRSTIFPDEDGFPDGGNPEGEPIGVVYFGDFFIAKRYYEIPMNHLRDVTTDDLMRRREELHNHCGWVADVQNRNEEWDPEEELDYLAELHYIDTVLIDRMMQARYNNKSKGSKVFISYSSRDKGFATWVGTDLRAAGHTPWFDEWDIRVGESIPERISQGLSEADFVAVVLSEHSTESKWVEREWHAKYWNEVKSGRIHVLPLLLRDCDIPELLKTKKYADFRNSYNNGLEDLLAAIDTLADDES
jgi:hypothetical protein